MEVCNGESPVKEGILVSKVQIHHKIHCVSWWFSGLYITKDLLWNLRVLSRQSSGLGRNDNGQDPQAKFKLVKPLLTHPALTDEAFILGVP